MTANMDTQMWWLKVRLEDVLDALSAENIDEAKRAAHQLLLNFQCAQIVWAETKEAMKAPKADGEQ